MRSVVVESLFEALALWINGQRENQSKPVIAFDVKVLRGSYRTNPKTALQLVTVYDTERGLVLSQKPTESKNGEINVLWQILDIINAIGSVITMDRLHCRGKTLEGIAARMLTLLFK